MPQEAVVPAPVDASEGVATDPAGSAAATPAEGAPAGSPAEGTPAAEGTIDHEARAREWQSRHDREVASRKAAESELATLRAAGNGSGGTAPEGAATSAPLSAVDVRGLLQQDREMGQMVSRVATDFPNAHPEIARRAWEYESPDALFLAARESHEQETAYREGLRKEEADRFRKEMKDRGIDLPEEVPPAVAGGGVRVDTLPTLKQIASMGQDELVQLEKDHPGHAEKLLTEAAPDSLLTA